MWIRTVAVLTIVSIVLVIGAPALKADAVKFKDGTEMEGIITKVADGKVFLRIANEEMFFDVLTVDSMDFNTPHLPANARDVPVAHFLKNVEAQEVVRKFEQLEQTEADIRSKLNIIRSYWGGAQPIAAANLPAWEKEKEEFKKPLNRYQEVLNDLYFHVLARVDGYNAMATDASEVYVGVKGIKIGSSLVPRDMRKLPLAKYVPGNWYDTIFYDGYNRGYEEAYEKFAPSKTSNNGF